jgi:hypothetical protein
MKLPFSMHEDHLYLEGSSFTMQEANRDGTAGADGKGSLQWPLHVVVTEAYAEPLLSRKLMPVDSEEEDLKVDPLLMLRFEPNLYWYLTPEANQ